MLWVRERERGKEWGSSGGNLSNLLISSSFDLILSLFFLFLLQAALFSLNLSWIQRSMITIIIICVIYYSCDIFYLSARADKIFLRFRSGFAPSSLEFTAKMGQFLFPFEPWAPFIKRAKTVCAPTGSWSQKEREWWFSGKETKKERKRRAQVLTTRPSWPPPCTWW